MNIRKLITQKIHEKALQAGCAYNLVLGMYDTYKKENKLGYYTEDTKTRRSDPREQMKTKNHGENAGQWGYIPFKGITPLVELIEVLKIDTMVDLGCGSGHLITTLRKMSRLGRVIGYEIEDALVEEHKAIFDKYDICVYKQDILKLDVPRHHPFIEEKISPLVDNNGNQWDAVYFYEPFADPKLRQKFSDHLEKVLLKGQYVFYMRAGSDEMIRTFGKSPRIRFVGEHCGIAIFKVTK